MNEFPSDSLVQVIENVFHFDKYNNELRNQLVSIFQEHGIPLGKNKIF